MEDTEKILAYLRKQVATYEAESDQLKEEYLNKPEDKNRLVQYGMIAGEVIAYNDVITKIQTDHFKP